MEVHVVEIVAEDQVADEVFVDFDEGCCCPLKLAAEAPDYHNSVLPQQIEANVGVSKMKKVKDLRRWCS